MNRSNRIRWRDRRDTLPARRRRRRRHRRDRSCSQTYYPMEVESDSALRGVRSRLVGALGAAAITLISFVSAILASLTTFGAAFALIIGVCSFGAAVALLLSARYEEEVHALASSFEGEDGSDEVCDKACALLEHDLNDGWFFEEFESVERAEPVAHRRGASTTQTDGAV